MTVTMQFVSVEGTYQFAADSMPLISRRVEYTRQGDVGYSLRKRNITLSGFFLGNNHGQIVSSYQALIAILKSNNAEFTYNVDGTDIIKTQVYIDDYGEPENWKEYDGTYTITFHYYEQPQNGIELGIACTYASEAGTWNFDPVPNWAGGFKRNRRDFRSPMFTPTGVEISRDESTTLTGWIVANGDAAEMQTKITDFKNILSRDGTLTYGNWMQSVRIENIEIPQSFPRDYCPFSISFHYDTTGIIEFSSTRRIGRLHNNPKIIQNPYCGTLYVKQYSQSGQEIVYNIKVRAYTVAQAREFLANEANNLISLGGVEMPGGSELWDDTETSVTLSCTKFHVIPVLANLAGT